MKNDNKLLTAAGIINIVLGVLIAFINVYIGLIIIVSGIYIMDCKSLGAAKVIKNKKLLTVLGFLFLVPIPISGMFILIGLDQVCNNYNPNAPPQDFIIEQQEEPIDKETKKVDSLLKLGVAMVAVSGLLFATTSWELITDLVKTFALLFMGVLFLGLSIFTEKKLKIRRSSNMYFILAMLFLVFAFVSIGYFGIINPWFTYFGEGKSLVYSLTFLEIACLSKALQEKLDKEEINYLIYTSAYLSVCSLLRFINLDNNLSLSIIVLINLIINIFIKNKNSLSKFTHTLEYIFPILIIYNYLVSSLLISTTIASAIYIINLCYNIYRKNNGLLCYITPIISTILSIVCISNMKINSYKMVLFILLISFLYFIIELIKRDNKILNYFNKIVYNTTVLFAFIIALCINTSIEIFIFAMTYLMTNLSFSTKLIEKDNTKISLFLQPVASYMFMIALSILIDKYLFAITVMNFFSITIPVYIVIHYIVRNNNHQSNYYWLLFADTILLTFINLFNQNPIAGLAIIVGYIYLFIQAKYKWNKVFNFTAILYSTYLLFNLKDFIPIPLYYTNIIIIWIYVLILFFMNQKNIYNTITKFVLIFPMITFIDNLTVSYEISSILINLVFVYILYLILTTICRQKTSKKVVSIIGFIFIILHIIFQTGLLVGIYVGILGLIIIFIGYNYKEYSHLFKIGIIIEIINIIYQLKDLWSKVPFWLYLLLTGLGLIGFVTYKELSKLKNK